MNLLKIIVDAGLLLAAILVVISVPDIARYIRIHEM